jgi:8-oxo-dGTP pyrophosphatase MutT (NUDIX family)
VLLTLHQEGLIPGWRNEPYPVNRSYTEPPCLLLERAAVPFFGVCGYGVHMNGYVRNDREFKMWIGRRSQDKTTNPGELDQLVAGGQPFGIGLRENMIKECREEAGIAQRIAERVVPVGAITYCVEIPQGIRPDVVFAYDLELPPEFEPKNNDGEVADFYLWPMERVIETVRDTTEFKYNCALVIIDFLIRHGFITPDHPDYLELLSGLLHRERLLAAVCP